MTVADALLVVAVLAGPIGLGIGEIRYRHHRRPRHAR